jgi:hypothetical protein
MTIGSSALSLVNAGILRCVSMVRARKTSAQMAVLTTKNVRAERFVMASSRAPGEGGTRAGQESAGFHTPMRLKLASAIQPV